MALNTLGTDDKQKLKQVISEGVKIMQEIEDLKGGLRDTVKAVATQLEVKPKVINRAIRAALKADIDVNKDELDTVEEILHVTGYR